MVDVKTSSLDSKISREMLDKLPTSRDSFYDLSLSTPGMFDVGKHVMGSPTAYGGSTQENIFLVNGVDTTNPRGAAIDVITKSGSNELRGSLGLYSRLGTSNPGTPKASQLGRDWLFLQPGDDYRAYPKSELEAALTVGGPFISKKLWFYAAGNILNKKNKELNWDPITKSIGRICRCQDHRHAHEEPLRVGVLSL